MIEAMDHEIARLLAEIDGGLGDTTIILVADNGTNALVQPDGSPYPAGHLKFSLFEGGINVPLIVSGPGVAQPGTRSSALVNTSDLFATVIELISGEPVEKLRPGAVLDSKSLVPILEGTSRSVRDTAFASGPAGHYAIRNTRYKLIREPEGEQLYDLSTDRHTEENDLLRRGELDPLAKTNHEELRRALDDLIAPARSACPIVAECTECCSEAPSPPAECTFKPARTQDPQRCLLRDAAAFVCQQGSIHVRICECGGAGADCAGGPPAGKSAAPPRTSRTLVCR
jgi:arylsulfatase A-like enzyme